MKSLNFFKQGSPYYSFRWFVVTVFIMAGWLAYADYTGWRIFSFNNQQTWSASGPGGHK